MNKVTLFLFIIFFISINTLYAQEDVEIIEKTEDASVPEGIPFATIEKVPTFPGCIGDDNAALKKCMSKHISKHVAENFNVDEASKGMVFYGKYRVYVSFTIDTTGVITDIKSYTPTQAPSPALKKEAVRVIEQLPRLIPGQEKGKNVAVLYTLPIIFNIPKDDSNSKGR